MSHLNREKLQIIILLHMLHLKCFRPFDILLLVKTKAQDRQENNDFHRECLRNCRTDFEMLYR